MLQKKLSIWSEELKELSIFSWILINVILFLDQFEFYFILDFKLK